MCEVDKTDLDKVIDQTMEQLEYGGYSWGDLDGTSGYFTPVIQRFLSNLKENGLIIVKQDNDVTN